MELVPGPVRLRGQLVNTQAAGYPANPTIRSADIAFGGEQVLTGPDPSRVTLTAWWPAGASTARPELDDELVIELGDGTRTAVVFTGNVDGVTRRRRPARTGRPVAGEWLTVTASDPLSGAGRKKIGDAPYPAEVPAYRWRRVADRVAALTLGIPIVNGDFSDPDNPWTMFADSRLRSEAYSYGSVAARDVDNQPVHDLLREACSGLGAVPIAVEAGIVPFRQWRAERTLMPDGSLDDHPDTVTIPARALPDPVLSLTATDVTNRIRIGYVGTDGETEKRYTLSWDDSIRQWGEHSVSWSTSMQDSIYSTSPDDPYVIGALVDRLRNAGEAQSVPAYRFDSPLVLTPSRLAQIPAGTDILRLLDVNTRHGAPIRIEHELDGIPTRFALRAGSIVIEDGRTSITIEPEPASHAGGGGLVFNGLGASAGVTYGMLDPTMTFHDTITIGVP